MITRIPRHKRPGITNNIIPHAIVVTAMRSIKKGANIGAYFCLLLPAINKAICIVSATESLGQQAISAVMGESTVVDRETGRIYWEGGSSNTLAESIAPKIRSVVGIPHMKATILTILLFLAFAGTISQQLGDTLHVDFKFGGVSSPFVQATLLSVTHAVLVLPKFQRWFAISILFLYLTEAYICSTHKYLSHVVNDTEAYIDQLRERSPIVEWKIRSFHFENMILSAFHRILQRSSNRHDLLTKDPSFPSLFNWKCVTHTATEYYNYTSYIDRTIAGVWKRASINMNPIQKQPSISRTVPFTKIVMSKTLLLRDTKTRQDYFAQQKSFLRNEHHDEYAEFSTNIYIDGFESRILAIPVSRNTGLSRWLIHRYMYWVFTCIGLTVPYRRWLSSHCDEIRVRVVKETSSDKVASFKIASSTSTP
jgi:hypothetical protein